MSCMIIAVVHPSLERHEATAGDLLKVGSLVQHAAFIPFQSRLGAPSWPAPFAGTRVDPKTTCYPCVVYSTVTLFHNR